MLNGQRPAALIPNMVPVSSGPLLRPAIALAATLLATAGVVAWNAHEDRSRHLANFRSMANERAGTIEMLLNIEVTRQTDVGALFLGSQRVEAQEFRDFVKHIYRNRPTVASSRGGPGRPETLRPRQISSRHPTDPLAAIIAMTIPVFVMARETRNLLDLDRQ